MDYPETCVKRAPVLRQINSPLTVPPQFGFKKELNSTSLPLPGSWPPKTLGPLAPSGLILSCPLVHKRCGIRCLSFCILIPDSSTHSFSEPLPLERSHPQISFPPPVLECFLPILIEIWYCPEDVTSPAVLVILSPKPVITLVPTSVALLFVTASRLFYRILLSL